MIRVRPAADRSVGCGCSNNLPAPPPAPCGCGSGPILVPPMPPGYFGAPALPTPCGELSGQPVGCVASNFGSGTLDDVSPAPEFSGRRAMLCVGRTIQHDFPESSLPPVPPDVRWTVEHGFWKIQPINPLTGATLSVPVQPPTCNLLTESEMWYYLATLNYRTADGPSSRVRVRAVGAPPADCVREVLLRCGTAPGVETAVLTARQWMESRNLCGVISASVCDGGVTVVDVKLEPPATAVSAAGAPTQVGGVTVRWLT